jgi:hypothetical protein
VLKQDNLVAWDIMGYSLGDLNNNKWGLSQPFYGDIVGYIYVIWQYKLQSKFLLMVPTGSSCLFYIVADWWCHFFFYLNHIFLGMMMITIYPN